ncbi:hypothetical protein WMY93_005509 [Mugilogobius chulae]|uniref:von Willebrand factor A domain-containing protein 7 n=1 Tax=Mugilogobius chulae TaxID=88201 RepID=A0AAW0PK66_9GOBI
MISLLGLAVLAAALTEPGLAFAPSMGMGQASTHITITRRALLESVMETCREEANTNGFVFKPTGDSPEEIVQACLGPTATGEVSGAKFRTALQEIYNQNAWVDRDFADSAPHHFNSEAFLEGRSLITEGVAAIKANIQNDKFQAARETLGKVLHTLQDFYSHSNWVELGNTEPYINLIHPSLPLENLAGVYFFTSNKCQQYHNINICQHMYFAKCVVVVDVNTPTCKDCVSGTCRNQLLPEILQYRMLTSGYMGIYSKEKPLGKCSHGGQSDQTSLKLPRGGIHKDDRRDDNRYNHDIAVKLATEATLQLLEDIRLAAGDKQFLRMLGIARSSVVCFVIDTTGSMSDDIDEARNVVYEIIDSKKGTQDEPSEYILVPFNDPGVGPITKTTDPEVMKKEISELRAKGGGDDPEMCYSGIQLALTTAPSYSSIFVFTDATAKDADLKDTLLALISTTKSEVNFLMTDNSKRRRRSTRGGSFNDYKDLALASGGQAIQVTKNQLPKATAIIRDTSTSARVTVLHQTKNPKKTETFLFSLDDSLKNITIYITGVTQTSTQTSGSLANITTVGNLWRSALNADRATGKWQISISSNIPYTVKVTGQSPIAFIYDFVEKFEGPHPGYAVLTGRPQDGQPTNLMLPVMGREGRDSLKITEVSLISMTSPGIVSTNTFTDMGNGGILVTFPVVPGEEFVVLLKGTDLVSKTEFQRQSTTQMSVSKVNIQATISSSLEPGKLFTLPFSVFTNGAGGQYKISARNDRNFSMNYPTSLNLTPGKSTDAKLTITPPAGTLSGTDVTLTLEASLGSDSNYVVLRLSVLEKITDFYPPLCEIINIQNSCPDVSLCERSVWGLTAKLTDGNGTGIQSVNLQQGNGNLTQVISGDPAQYNYSASCCSQVVEIVAVDKIGNVGKCYHSIERNAIWGQSREGKPEINHNVTAESRCSSSRSDRTSPGLCPNRGGASTHVSITGTALLEKVMETCKAVANDNGYEFKPTGSSPEEIVQACLGPTATGDVSGAKFHSALQEIYMQNGLVDRDFVNSAPHHFNSEAFLEGRGLITEGVAAIKANIRNENFQAARETLGKVLHVLQDFYSHSNWVELGHKEPYLNLIRPDLPIENIVDVGTPTCRDCAEGTCTNQILSSILTQGKLTSGYMGIFSDAKPSGKCSHGGASDLTSFAVPRGGIHKDERRPDNKDNHDTAVKLATEATSQLLENVRLAAGNNDFLRMLGIARSSVVCFVIDTTGSMKDDIDEARSVVYEIIDSKKGTQDEPSEYILVPFNDPKFGPVTKTADPEVMKKEISKLKADGGGDLPEMCYSGIQLALTTAPSYSNIYVFTDAGAKDAELKDTLVALIRSTKSTRHTCFYGETQFYEMEPTNQGELFMTGSKRRRRSTRGGTFNDYKDLALASGGQAIQVTKGQLPEATDIILDTSTSALVTILQQARNPGKAETFLFSLDDSLKTSPSTLLAQLLVYTDKSSCTLNADRATGKWQISISSNNPYTIKVTGQSTIAFIYDFVEKFEGPHPGYAVLSGRPQEGPASLKINQVSLVSVSSSASTNASISDMGNGDILATVDVVPGGEFVVLLKGIDTVSNTEFQRQSTTQMSVSKVNIQAIVSSSMEPGKPFILPFSVFTNGTGGEYKISARNDRNYPMNYPTSLTLTSGQYTNTTLTIVPPAGTLSGTDVTLTLDASRGSDSNYVVLRLSVLEKITDFYPPLCQIISIQDACPHVSLCENSMWELVANLTDGNGTGIQSVNLQQGNGNLTQVISGDPAQYNYNASCFHKWWRL